MKKLIILEENDTFGYSIPAEFSTWNLELWYVFEYLRGFSRISPTDRSYNFEEGYNISIYDGKVEFWTRDDVKSMLFYSSFTDDQKLREYIAAYRQYSDKRHADKPKVTMTLENHNELCEKWLFIKMRKPRYLILSQDDSGYVDILGKDELSEQDLHDIKIEHEIALRNKAAWYKYEAANPDRSTVWRSPADDEFEADWQKYLE